MHISAVSFDSYIVNQYLTFGDQPEKWIFTVVAKVALESRGNILHLRKQ